MKHTGRESAGDLFSNFNHFCSQNL